MSRKTGTKDFGPPNGPPTLRLMVTQLAPMRALELLPEVASIMVPLAVGGGAAVFNALIGGAAPTIEQAFELLPSIGTIAGMLTNKRLAGIAAPLLSSSIAIVDPLGKSPVKFELSSAANIDIAFSDNVSKLLMAAWFAMGVTFRDFLDELKPAADGDTTPTP